MDIFFSFFFFTSFLPSGNFNSVYCILFSIEIFSDTYPKVYDNKILTYFIQKIILKTQSFHTFCQKTRNQNIRFSSLSVCRVHFFFPSYKPLGSKLNKNSMWVGWGDLRLSERVVRVSECGRGENVKFTFSFTVLFLIFSFYFFSLIFLLSESE